MINQNNQNENTKNEFSYAIKELGIGKLLRQSNITKNCGIPAFEVFQFLLLLAVKVTTAFDRLSKPNRVKAFVLDDSVIKSNRYQEISDKIDHRTNGYN